MIHAILGNYNEYIVMRFKKEIIKVYEEPIEMVWIEIWCITAKKKIVKVKH